MKRKQCIEIGWGLEGGCGWVTGEWMGEGEVTGQWLGRREDGFRVN